MVDLKKVQQHIPDISVLSDDDKITAPLSLGGITVSSDWIDFNGHVNESMYVLMAGCAAEMFRQHIGLKLDWIKTKGTTFTVEAHNTYLKECYEGDELQLKTQLIDFDAKRLHILNYVYRGDELCFVGEQLSVYVCPIKRKVIEFHDEISERLERIKQVHKDMPQDFTSRKACIRKK